MSDLAKLLKFYDDLIDGLLSLTREQVEQISDGYDQIVNIWQVGKKDRAKAQMMLDEYPQSMLLVLQMSIEDMKR